MRRVTLFLLCMALLLVVLSPAARAQQWSGVLAPSRAVDWSKAGVTGGIPNRTTICATLNSGATGDQINAAISSCPSGQVVMLNAGTYSVANGIVMSSGVVLRGAGANQDPGSPFEQGQR